MSDKGSSLSSGYSSAPGLDASDQGKIVYTAEELYAAFPQFLKKDDVELFDYFKRGPDIPDDPILVSSWVDAQLDAVQNGMTLDQKKAAIGAALVANNAQSVGIGGNAFFFGNSAELFAARGNMRDPGQPNNVAWAFNIGARTAGMIGGNVVATPARVHSIVINSVSDCEDCEHCCQNNTYTVNYEIRFFEI